MSTQEEWALMKPINLSNYQISTLGRIFNIQTERFVSGTIRRDGYVDISLIDDTHINKKHKLHRLVAQIFLPNPENKLTVDHIDRDRTNNKLSNLRWASHSEQRINQRKPTKTISREIYQLDQEGNIIKRWSNAAEISKEFNIPRRNVYDWCNKNSRNTTEYLWKYVQEVDIPENEEWRDVPRSDFIKKVQASSLGRIKVEGRILMGSIQNYGYRGSYFDTVEFKKVFLLFHRLIALTFLGYSILPVNHKNGDKLDNSVINLEYVTTRENNIHAIKLGLRSKKKGYITYQLDLDGNILKEFSSITQASKEIGCSPTVLSNLFRKNNPEYPIYMGYRWRCDCLIELSS